MSAPIPIVFIHLSSSEYLRFTLGQAKMKNLNSPVILIGDDTNNAYPFATHVNMNRYCKQAVEFQKIYKHYSPNGYVYEQFCFIRWFLLRDFMKQHGINQVMHLDSDVLLYVDVTQERENWKDFDLTVLHGEYSGNMFINGLRGLEDFCEMIWKMYAAPGADERLSALLESRRCPGRFAVSDMALMGMMSRTHPDRVAEMTGIQPDGSHWDNNIRMDEGFEMHDGRKRYWFENGRAYCRHIASGRDIWFKTLHFQGAAKAHIESAFHQGMAKPLGETQAA